MKILKQIQVTNLRSETTLSNYLLHSVKGIGKQKLENLLYKKEITLNRQIATGNEILSNGDEIRFYSYLTEKNDSINAENIPLQIIYEQDDFIVINKAAGMACHTGLGIYKGTLLNALKYYFEQKNMLTLKNGLVHRLDRDTSGLILLAKNKVAFEHFAHIFKEKKAVRIYDAVCEGVISEDSFQVEKNVGRDAEVKSRIRFFEEPHLGKYAKTQFKTLQRGTTTTLVECTPITGRTHQIRLHLLYVGHPICGDKRYNTSGVNHYGRMYLHAKKLSFEYCGKSYDFEAASGFESII